MVPKIHKSVLHKVLTLVGNAYNISFTTDIWTNVSNYSFLSVTGHCLDENFTSSTVVLRVVPFDESHTAASISTLLQRVRSDYNIAKHKVHILFLTMLQILPKAYTLLVVKVYLVFYTHFSW